MRKLSLEITRPDQLVSRKNTMTEHGIQSSRQRCPDRSEKENPETKTPRKCPETNKPELGRRRRGREGGMGEEREGREKRKREERERLRLP